MTVVLVPGQGTPGTGRYSPSSIPPLGPQDPNDPFVENETDGRLPEGQPVPPPKG